jgi:hypothetical protein
VFDASFSMQAASKWLDIGMRNCTDAEEAEIFCQNQNDDGCMRRRFCETSMDDSASLVPVGGNTKPSPGAFTCLPCPFSRAVWCCSHFSGVLAYVPFVAQSVPCIVWCLEFSVVCVSLFLSYGRVRAHRVFASVRPWRVHNSFMHIVLFFVAYTFSAVCDFSFVFFVLSSCILFVRTLADRPVSCLLFCRA